MKNRKTLLSLVLLILFSPVFSQDYQVFQSIKEAKSHSLEVKHLAPQDFDPSKDGFVLTEFPNLEILDLSVSQNVKMVPLGLKKLTKLKYLNISNTEIGLLYPYVKKMTQLKEIVAVNASVSAAELNKIEKKTNIKIAKSFENASQSFKNNSSNSGSPVISNTKGNEGKNEKPIGSQYSKDEDGLFISNPNNVTIDDTKSVWLVTKEGKNYACKKKKAFGLISEAGGLLCLLPSNFEIYNQVFSEGKIGFSDKSKSSHKYGYLDKNGKVIIQPQFDNVKPFRNGMAIVKLDGKYGAINAQGKLVIPAKYSHIDDFINGTFTFMKMEGDKNYGVITKTGEVVSSNVFTFEEYRLKIKSGSNSNSYFRDQALRSERVLCAKQGKYGYKNLKGEWVVEPVYDDAYQFIHGLAVVGKKMSGTQRYGVLKPNGEEILSVEYAYISTPFANSYEENSEVSFSASKAGEKWAIYNQDGRVIFGPMEEINGYRIMKLAPFKMDAAQVVLYDSKENDFRHPSSFKSQTTFLNKKGEFLFEPDFMLADNVNRNGLILYTNFNSRNLMTALEESSKANFDKQKEAFLNSCGYKIGYKNLKGETVIEVEGKAPMETFAFGFEHNQVMTDINSYSLMNFSFSYTLDGSTWQNTMSCFGTKLIDVVKNSDYSSYGIFAPGSIQALRLNNDKGSMINLKYIDLKSGKTVYENSNAKSNSVINEGVGVVYPAGYIIEMEEL